MLNIDHMDWLPLQVHLLMQYFLIGDIAKFSFLTPESFDVRLIGSHFFNILSALGVSYLKDGQCVAVGIPFFERNFIHGYPIPANHICVQILAVTKRTRAPFVLGMNVEGNLELSIGCLCLMGKFSINVHLMNSIYLGPFQ